MKQLRFVLPGLLAFVAWSATPALASRGQSAEPAQAPAGATLPASGIYVFQNGVTVRPGAYMLDGELIDNPTGMPIYYGKNEPVAIESQPDGRVLVTALLSPEDAEIGPSQALVTLEEFRHLGLKLEAQGGPAELRAHYSYLEEVEVAGTGQRVKKARFHYGGKTGCVAFVASQIRWPKDKPLGYGPEVTAKLVASKKYRYSKNCKNPPVGTVAAWTRGRRGKGGKFMGHVGIWNGNCYKYDIGCGDPGDKYQWANCAAPI